MRTLLPLLSSGLLLGCTALPTPLPQEPARGQHPRCPGVTTDQGAIPVACAEEPPLPDTAAVSRLQRYLLLLHPEEVAFEGRFRAAFVIDTSGRVIGDSVQIPEATPDRFAQRYAEDFMRAFRFRPARLGRHPVAVRFTQEVQYQRPGFRLLDTLAPPLERSVQFVHEHWGARLALRWLPVAAEPLRDPDAEIIHQAQLSAVEEILRRLPDSDSLAYACVSLSISPDGLSPADQRRLEARRPRVVRGRDCPPTYGGMLQVLDSLGNPRVRPPAAGPDPYHVRVTRVTPWSSDWAVVRVSEGKASSGEEHRCEVRRVSGAWRSECTSYGRWIS
jgi:hypothetical protein